MYYVILCVVNYPRPSSTQLVSNTVELLVHSCSSQDRDIRFAAAENLRKLIKVSNCKIASFPGHSHHQYLIACHISVLQGESLHVLLDIGLAMRTVNACRKWVTVSLQLWENT